MILRNPPVDADCRECGSPWPGHNYGCHQWLVQNQEAHAAEVALIKRAMDQFGAENELLRAALKRHHSYRIDPAYCRSELGRQTEALVGPSGAVFPDEQKAGKEHPCQMCGNHHPPDVNCPDQFAPHGQVASETQKTRPGG